MIVKLKIIWKIILSLKNQKNKVSINLNKHYKIHLIDFLNGKKNNNFWQPIEVIFIKAQKAKKQIKLI